MYATDYKDSSSILKAFPRVQIQAFCNYRTEYSIPMGDKLAKNGPIKQMIAFVTGRRIAEITLEDVNEDYMEVKRYLIRNKLNL
jgi:hypothetical protein